MRPYLAIFRRDLAAAIRTPSGWAFGLVFFFLFVALSSFALGPDPARLAAAAPAIAWLAMTFSVLIAMRPALAEPLESGEFEWLMTEPISLTGAVIARLSAQLLVIAGPLILALPGAALLLSYDQGWLLAGVVALGAPGLILYAAVGAAVGAAARGAGGLIAPLISGPLLAPALIFGVGAAQSGTLFGADAKALAAASLFAAAVCPPVCAMILRAAAD